MRSTQFNVTLKRHADGSSVDNVAAFAMGADVGQKVRMPRRRPKAHVDHAAPCFEGNIVDAASAADAGIV
jgi:hypothetical protein